jgi:hypothetical protein
MPRGHTVKKLIVIVSLFVIAVVPGGNAARADEGRKFSREGFTFVLPQRWNAPKDHQPKGRKKAKEKIVVLTKDGLLLDKVEFRKRLIDAGFEHTDKELSAGMMPQETAGVVLNDFEMNEAMNNFLVIENKPATVAGVPGFRLVFRYKQNGTLQYQCVYYGFQKGDMYYSIWYSAPKRHYFDTNLETFEKIVKTVALGSEREKESGAWSPDAGVN